VSRLYAGLSHTRVLIGERTLIDLIVVVLSTGGILLMAGYAVLCDKI
jgi:hypothetical protein